MNITLSMSLVWRCVGIYNEIPKHTNHSIHEQSGERLPTIDELKRVIDACGGDAERIHLQKQDTDYEACIERKGFPLRYLYQSSSLYENANDKAQFMHLTTGVFHTPKSYKDGVVYCVKDE